MQPTQADSEIEEEHLLNFVVNSLDDDLPIDLGENVEVTTETLYEVLAGASAGGTSINHVCETTEDSPHANTVRGHLTDQFDLETVEAVGNTLLQRDVLETLRIDRWRSSPTSISIPTTVTKMRQRRCTSRRRNEEPLRSTRTSRCMRGCATRDTRWRFASWSLAKPPAMPSVSSSTFSTV